MIKKLLSFILLVSLTFAVFAQPAGYYDNATGKSGAELKTALYNIIKGHTSISYDALWTAFQTTDKKANGKVWDMYSNIEFTFGSNQCGSYSGEGSCYNREHSFPKSWFSEGTPMYTDLFHLYPTDGYVNGRRSNYPFGEVTSPTYTSGNGSKLGSCSYPGYTGVVFEPIDEYKGDFARSYFYMVTRYENVVSNWNTDMLDGSTFPAFSIWAKNMLLEWSQQDPVSIKEIDRNNAVYSIQHNRNPFIDHPEYAEAVWGNGTIALNFISSPISNATIGQVYSYSISVTGPIGSTYTITATTKPAWLNLTQGTNGNATLSGTPLAAGSDNVTLSVTDGTTIKTQSFTITIAALEGLKFSSTPVISATTGSQYSYSVVATNQSNPSSTITISATTKPAWLTLTSTGNGTATLSGTPSTAGSDNVILTANDGITSVNQNFTIVVALGGLTKTETFENIPTTSPSSYSNRSWTGDNSISWNATLARTDQTINNKAICFQQSGSPELLSGTISGGCSQISFKHQQKFTGSGGAVSIFINNQQVGNPIDVNATEQTAVINGFNIAGDFTIKLVTNGTSRIAIDDLSWLGASGLPNTKPSITNITNLPVTPTTTDDVIISASISDSDGTISSVELKWGLTLENLNNTLSMALDGNVYKTTIPAQSKGTIYVSINAKDNLDAISTVLYDYDVIQNEKPAISNISNSPQGPLTGQPIAVSATITDSDGTIQEAWLDWGTTSNNLSNRVNLVLSSGSYSGTIPAQSQAGTIYLSIGAQDDLLATTSVQSSFTISPNTSVINEENNPKVKVFPNPARNQITVEVQEINTAKIIISNILGVTIFNMPYSSSKQPIDISQLNAGVYFVIVTGDGFRSTTRIVVY